MRALKTALFVVVVALAPLLATPSDAAPRMRCLSRAQQRIAIAEHRALTLAEVRRAVRRRVPGELLRARLCVEAQRLIYLLTVLPGDGKVRRVIIDAKTGEILRVR